MATYFNFVSIVLSCLVLICVLLFAQLFSNNADFNVLELIKKSGYPLEIHKFQTEDGYILTLHRIPYGTQNSTTNKRVPVILSHGVLNSAAEFVCSGPGKSLGLLLADRGYDVWLFNSRGTTWSRQHVLLDPDKDLAYWNFTMHEVGVYDTINAIDYVLNETKTDGVHFVGYSQGTAAFCIGIAERPEYASKIKLMSGMAPVIYAKDVKSPILRLVMFLQKALEKLQDLVRITEFHGENSFLSIYIKFVCGRNAIFNQICLNGFYLLQGETDLIRKEVLPAFAANLPAGGSFYQALHLLQFLTSGKIKKYDWGEQQNLVIYNQTHPDEYNISRITNPVAFYHGNNDWISGKNVEKYSDTFPNLVENYVIPDAMFTHMDFLIGENVENLVYQPMIKQMDKFR